MSAPHNRDKKTVIACPGNIPALSQWGLILFGLLLLIVMARVFRRGGPVTPVAASLLLLMSAGLIAVSVSYSEIQANRVCGETDVAVEFVRDLLQS